MRFHRLLAIGLVLAVSILALGAKKPPEPPSVKVHDIRRPSRAKVPLPHVHACWFSWVIANLPRSKT